MKTKYWMIWMWNAIYYYCRVPSQRIYEELRERMEKYTSSYEDGLFSNISLKIKEPKIGEYLPRKRLEFFLDNMNNFKNHNEEVLMTMTIQDSINQFNL